jgi:hypothetical protein
MMEAEKADEAASDTGLDKDKSDVPLSPQEHARREGMLTLAGLVLAGITVVGLALMWAVMLWGRRLRRFARKMSPSPTVVDELWYLKAKKSVPSSRLETDEAAPPNPDEPTST